MAPKKMVPRRPIQSLRGSETHPALDNVSSESMRKAVANIQQADCDVRQGVDETDDPAVGCTLAGVGIGAARGAGGVRDTESIREGQVGAVGTSLQAG